MKRSKSPDCGCVYSIRDPDNGEIRYVGFSLNPDKRFKEHLYSGRRKLDGRPLYVWLHDVLKLGKLPIFKIEAEGVTSHMRMTEERLIALHRPSQLLLNVLDGPTPIVPREARLRAGLKLKNRIFSDAHRARISQAKTGKPRTDREAVIERMRRVAEANRGKRMTLSPEQRQKRSDLGRIAVVNTWRLPPDVEAEKRRKISETMKRVWAERRCINGDRSSDAGGATAPDSR